MQKISGEFGEFKVACAIFSPFFHSLDLLVLLHQSKRTGNRYSYLPLLVFSPASINTYRGLAGVIIMQKLKNISIYIAPLPVFSSGSPLTYAFRW